MINKVKIWGVDAKAIPDLYSELQIKEYLRNSRFFLPSIKSGYPIESDTILSKISKKFDITEELKILKIKLEISNLKDKYFETTDNKLKTSYIYKITNLEKSLDEALKTPIKITGEIF